MRILRNYILKEIFQSFMMTLGVFTFVLLMGNFIKIFDLVINKGVNILSVLNLFLYLMPYLLSFTVPMSVLTATLLVFGRLSGDNEITAMRASGISIYKIYQPVILFALLLSFALVPLNDRLLPKAHFETRKILKNIGMNKPAAYLEAGTFIRDFQDYIIFIYEINGNKFKNIRVYQPQEGGQTRTIVASRGEFIPMPKMESVKLKLEEGTYDFPNPENPSNFYKMNFKQYEMDISLKNISKNKIDKKAKDMTFDELKKEIDRRKVDEDPIPVETELHKKISMSFSSVAFVFIGLPLAIKTRRGEKSVGFGISLGIIMFYWLLLAGGEAIALKHILPPAIAMWLSNIVLFITGAILMAVSTEK